MAPDIPDRPVVLVFTNGHEFTVQHRQPLLDHFRDQGWAVVGLAPNGSPALTAFTSLGYPTRAIRLSRAGTNPATELRALAAVWSVYREVRPTLAIHATVKPVLYGSLAARAQGVPVVNLITGLGYLFSGMGGRASATRTLITALYRAALAHPRQRVIFQNRDDRDELLELARVPESTARIVPGSGVDIHRFIPLDDSNADRQSLVALVGRMLEDKGVFQFTEAARILKPRFPDTRFVLVGPIDLENPSRIDKQTLESTCARSGVEWWGQVNDVSEVYRQASLIVLPSRREGMPKVVLEAAACGLPVVTTDVPGCRDSVIDGRTGYLVPCGDPHTLAERIERLLANSELRRDFGKRARDLAETRFSSDIIVGQIARTAMELL